jgi:hypothetical protein
MFGACSRTLNRGKEVVLHFVTLFLPQADLQLLNAVAFNAPTATSLLLDLPASASTNSISNDSTSRTMSYRLTRPVAQALQDFNSAAGYSHLGGAANWMSVGSVGVSVGGWYGIGFENVSMYGVHVVLPRGCLSACPFTCLPTPTDRTRGLHLRTPLTRHSTGAIAWHADVAVRGTAAAHADLALPRCSCST